MSSHSCVIRIHNGLGVKLVLKNKAAQWGYWLKPPNDPPVTIWPNEQPYIALYDSFGFAGSEGSLTYMAEAVGTFPEAWFDFSFCCGWTDNNYFDVGNRSEGKYVVKWKAWNSKEAEAKWGECPPKGTPLNILAILLKA